ncbi:MAG: peptide deformylase [Candidatus Blackburnbacteria bacterium]|nr:peptide deformylase [Candidatus Blackburnbacteria bacterium]
MEGCLSLPHYYGPVQRAESVTLKYLKIAAEGEPRSPRCEAGLWRENLKLKTSRRKFSGFLAHIIQHEVDHLNGILFVDRLLQQNRTLFQLKGKEWNKVELI